MEEQEPRALGQASAVGACNRLQLRPMLACVLEPVNRVLRSGVRRKARDAAAVRMRCRHPLCRAGFQLLIGWNGVSRQQSHRSLLSTASSAKLIDNPPELAYTLQTKEQTIALLVPIQPWLPGDACRCLVCAPWGVGRPVPYFSGKLAVVQAALPPKRTRGWQERGDRSRLSSVRG